MYWLLGYLAGACLAGFIFEICYVYIDSFYKLLVRKIDNAKDELRKTDDLSDEYRILLDDIDNDTIIKSLEVLNNRSFKISFLPSSVSAEKEMFLSSNIFLNNQP